MNDRGLYGLGCFNGLDAQQQERLVRWGNLPFGYEPNGPCDQPAEVEVFTVWDAKPGPRFYCRPCAVDYLRTGLTITPIRKDTA